MSYLGTTAYIGLGGNIGDTFKIFQSAIELIGLSSNIWDLDCSRVYKTSPVNPFRGLPQNDYLNAVCCFKTDLSVSDLWILLRTIEKTLGRKPAPKNSPRVIDLDILFFGNQRCMGPDLIIPHPRWYQRLFVLIPLLDLTEQILLLNPERPEGYDRVDIAQIIQDFSNPYEEKITLLPSQIVPCGALSAIPDATF